MKSKNIKPTSKPWLKSDGSPDRRSAVSKYLKKDGHKKKSINFPSGVKSIPGLYRSLQKLSAPKNPVPVVKPKALALTKAKQGKSTRQAPAVPKKKITTKVAVKATPAPRKTTRSGSGVSTRKTHHVVPRRPAKTIRASVTRKRTVVKKALSKFKPKARPKNIRRELPAKKRIPKWKKRRPVIIKKPSKKQRDRRRGTRQTPWLKKDGLPDKRTAISKWLTKDGKLKKNRKLPPGVHTIPELYDYLNSKKVTPDTKGLICVQFVKLIWEFWPDWLLQEFDRFKKVFMGEKRIRTVDQLLMYADDYFNELIEAARAERTQGAKDKETKTPDIEIVYKICKDRLYEYLYF